VLAGVALAAGGTLDAGFGDGGIVVTASNRGGTLRGVATQSTGKIVTVYGARASGGPYVFTVRRHNADGTLDTAFGSGGSVAPFSAALDSFAFDLAVDGDDGIVAVGWKRIERQVRNKTQTLQVVAIARLDADGSLDTGFGTAGTVLTEIPGSTVARGLAVALQSDGKIVVAGGAAVAKKKTSSDAVILVRYTGSGGLDTTFGTSGIVIDDVTTGDDWVQMHSIGLQSSGKIVVGGYRDGPGGDGTIRRYNVNGSPDTTFSSVVIGGIEWGVAIDIDASDRILAGGQVSGEGFVSRYAANGALDTSFGSGGTFTTGFADGNGLRSVSARPDGTILAGGVVGASALWDGFVVKLTSGGAADSGFGSGGFSDLTTPGDGRVDNIFDMAVDPDGNILLAGDSFEPGGSIDWLLARYSGS
jgi:uncharacterized delta-60 repeat protein